MISKSAQTYGLRKDSDHWLITFDAMASPCEIHVRTHEMSEADKLASLALSETRRIETTYSRYRDDNIVYAFNTSNGSPIRADEELARLLNYADQCYKLSEGQFDITSGVLRRAWQFNGQPYTPDNDKIEEIRKLVGWDKVEWDGTSLRLQPGMEIDFGGIGKEYAVDVVAELLFRESGVPLMVNFGGDIRAMTDDAEPVPWIIGIEDPTKAQSAVGEIKLTNGGVATSGDLNRFCLVDGKRMGHILNPTTGWPVADAPRSVTVLGNYCVEAGFLATLSILHGPDAEQFLKEQNAQGHCIR